MNNEREILFLKCFKFQKEGKAGFGVSYVNCKNFQPVTNFINAIEYDRIIKKLGDKHLVKCIGLLALDDFDRAYLTDIKSVL